MEHIIKLLEEFKDNKRGLMTKLRYCGDLVKDITTLTYFLDKDSTISERVYCLYNNITYKPSCPICGNQLRFEKMNKGYFSSCGDAECKKAIHLTNTKKAVTKKDHTAIYEKAKKTNLERYGVEHTQSKGSKIRERRDRTMVEKYGSIHALQVKKFNHKQKASFKEYNTDGVHTEKIKHGIIKKYGTLENYKVIHGNQIKDSLRVYKEYTHNVILQKIETMGLDVLSVDGYLFQLKCVTCGTIISTRREYINIAIRNNDNLCYICNPKNKFRSNFEQDVLEFVKSIYDGEIQINRRYLGAEVDILIPELKIGIECNGVYWHSELYKPRDVHKTKKQLIESQGYDLIQIWDDDWNDVYKNDIIKSRLKSKLGVNTRVYARKCICREISNDAVKDFLTINHLHGYAKSSINIGLFYENKLVSVCTFSKPRNSISTKDETAYELVRNCTLMGYNIVGGFSRMIKYFSKVYNKDIYSYADCDWVSTNHSGYINSGFVLESYTPPTYWWVLKTVRENRIKFQKHKLVNQGYDKNMTEVEIMHSIGYQRVFGSGNLKFRYTLDNKKGE